VLLSSLGDEVHSNAINIILRATTKPSYKNTLFFFSKFTSGDFFISIILSFGLLNYPQKLFH